MTACARRALGVLLAAASVEAAAHRPGRPRVLCQPPGGCAVSALPPTVAEAEVARYLKSGLTTTLLLTLSGRDAGRGRLEASAAVEVRFEPWEEVFHVTLRARGQPPRPHRVPSEAAFREWWGGLRLDFILDGMPQGQARLELVVIPFSEEEEADTRRWYAEALRQSGGADAPSPGLGQALDAVTLTSIKRRGVLRFSWSAPVERAR